MMKKEAEVYRDRWRLVEKVQSREHRHLSIEGKLRQSDQCHQTAAELGLLKRYAATRRKDEKEVQLLWHRLIGLAV